ncbi:MAG: hypothetical protein GXP40_10020 [Chloroflexi bacterium]|nr:hypothetical protein [Chloroflexota bacterium]
MENNFSQPVPRSKRWLNPGIVLAILWGLLFMAIGAVTEPTPENLTLLLSITASGLYTLGLFVTRPIWLPFLSGRPLRNAALLGIFNAAAIETLFLVIEKITGAKGVAAHPNLLLDLIMTMPWYVMMVITFVKVQHRRRFAPAVVLLLGAVYELGADGIVGPLIGLLFGDTQIFTLEYWLLLGLAGVWAFIPVYSSMVLPPVADRDCPAPVTANHPGLARRAQAAAVVDPFYRLLVGLDPLLGNFQPGLTPAGDHPRPGTAG